MTESPLPPTSVPARSSVHPLSALRIVLIPFYLLVVLLDWIVSMPVWMTVLIFGLLGSAVVIWRIRTLAIELLRHWKTLWIPAAVTLSLVLYTLIDVLAQTTFQQALLGGGFAASEPPLMIRWFLSLRAHADALPPMAAVIGLSVAVALSEELFWRGFVMTRLMPVVGHGLAALLSALLFGLYYYLLLGYPTALLAIFFGLLLSLMVLQSRSLLPALLCHAGFLLLVLWLRPDIRSLIP